MNDDLVALNERNIFPLTLCRFSLLVLHLERALILRDEWRQAVLTELLVALLLLGAELLQHCSLALASLEVARVASQLDPLVLLVLVRLDEGRPLHHAAKFLPVRRLEKSEKNGR